MNFVITTDFLTFKLYKSCHILLDLGKMFFFFLQNYTSENSTVIIVELLLTGKAAVRAFHLHVIQ